MSSYSDFQNNSINKSLNYVYYFFIINIYFVLSNLFLLVSINLVELKINNIIILFIALIPTGPALVALFSLMCKLNYNKEIYVTRDFFKGYIKNLKSSLKLWMVLLSLTTILGIDLVVCFQNGKFPLLILPIVLMLVFIVMIALYSMPILSRYEVSIRHNIKLSIYFIFKRPLIAIVNVIIFIVWLRLLLFNNIFVRSFVSGVSAFLIIKNLKSIFAYIDDEYFEKIEGCKK